MSNKSKREYVDAIRERYRLASKRSKQHILDECCQVCGYNRKYAIRVLNAPPRSTHPCSSRRPGPSPQYTHPDILRFLKRLWKASNLACGKRLKVMIALWLPFDQTIAAEARAQLTTISAATIDRMLAPFRHLHTKRGLATTKPGSLLKKHIPIKTNQWDEHIPGWLEADTVAHCGTSMAGMFVFTLNTVDIATNWVRTTCTLGQG